jgi:hypothetical protein
MLAHISNNLGKSPRSATTALAVEIKKKQSVPIGALCFYAPMRGWNLNYLQIILSFICSKLV